MLGANHAATRVHNNSSGDELRYVPPLSFVLANYGLPCRING